MGAHLAPDRRDSKDVEGVCLIEMLGLIKKIHGKYRGTL